MNLREASDFNFCDFNVLCGILFRYINFFIIWKQKLFAPNLTFHVFYVSSLNIQPICKLASGLVAVDFAFHAKTLFAARELCYTKTQNSPDSVSFLESKEQTRICRAPCLCEFVEETKKSRNKLNKNIFAKPKNKLQPSVNNCLCFGGLI